MTNSLSNKTVFISGAAGGIGEALCNSFASANARIIMHCNSNREKAESIMSNLPKNKHMIVQGDLSKADNIKKIFNEIDSVDVVVNNAALIEKHEIESLSFESWQKIWNKTLDINLLGPAHIIYFASQ